MSAITFETRAFSKVLLHAVKYPHCAVNGVLLADANSIKDGAKHQDLNFVDAIPLFHHNHYVSPMAEIALTQIDSMAADENCVIAGYYAACENYNDNTVEKCPGQKIADKIVEYFPSAVFVVIDNTKISETPEASVFKLHRYNEGKWKHREDLSCKIDDQWKTQLILRNNYKKSLVDFDNYLDDPSLDWTNLEIEKTLAAINQSNIESIHG